MLTDKTIAARGIKILIGNLLEKNFYLFVVFTVRVITIFVFSVMINLSQSISV